ncbi:MAG: flagellar M-ring protein FliF [Lachnospiraceae bacterium]|nr:flagellar M-ring protein FliF [Lachnospiraceae bacterium]
MMDRIKAIPAKVLEWWNRFTAKQKTIIVCIAAGVILALAILATVLTRPQYVVLANCETTKEASTIVELLEGEQITYETSSDGLTIRVLKKDESEASLLLGANDIPAASYGIENVTNGGFSTTESDKQKTYKLYLEKKMEEDLMTMSSIKKADVQFSIPENDGTLIAKSEESHASIILELDGEFTQENASAVARIVATALGNETTNNIVIIDTMGNLLFSGEENYSISGNANSQLAVKQQAEKMVQEAVRKVLLGTNEFTNVEVSSNLSLDFSSKELTSHDYTAADGQDQGLKSHEDIYEAESTGGTSGVPGTDSNGTDNDTTYVMPDSEISTSSTSERSTDYLPNEKITKETVPPGVIQYAESSLSAAAINYKVINEDDIKAQGLLDGITWEEYKAANGERTKLDVDPDLVTVVARATGIPEENIMLVAYEEPMFIDSEGSSFSTTDIVTIILIIVILALLAFVVFRSMAGEKKQEQEEELSVESLLQSTPESDLEDIEMNDKSEARKLIEKFVDENPEAVANLLRNWLNEDWG